MRHLPARIGDVLVVAPHPDDEAIGAYGLMAALRARGARLWVLVASDGAASHPGSLRWPAARLIAERRRETRRAMRSLGIPPARIRFLGLPDGALAEHATALGHAIGRALRRIPPPGLIVGPDACDAHHDHRAVAAALRQRRARHRVCYRVWPLGARGAGRLRQPLDARTAVIKRRVIRSYRTQAGLIADSPSGMAMRPHHLRSFAGPAEWFGVVP